VLHDVHLRDRNLHAVQSGHVYRPRVQHAWDVPIRHGDVHAIDARHWRKLHGCDPERVRHLQLHDWNLHRDHVCHLHGERWLPRGRHVQSDDGHVLESASQPRHSLQRH